MREQIQFGSTKIEYDLEYSNRKSLGITVTPELNVLVCAPFDAPINVIEQKVRKRAPWIIKQRSFFLTFHPKTPARRFLSGETHLYMGRQYLLRIDLNDDESVKLSGRHILVSTRSRNRAAGLVKDWYLQKAKRNFPLIAAPLIERFKKLNVEPSEVVLRDMSTRWGSCTPQGKVILNPELIKAPKGCIEYVIVHELCHLIHRDHNKKFIDLQSAFMPDYEKWKTKLERLMA